MFFKSDIESQSLIWNNENGILILKALVLETIALFFMVSNYGCIGHENEIAWLFLKPQWQKS